MPNWPGTFPLAGQPVLDNKPRLVFSGSGDQNTSSSAFTARNVSVACFGNYFW